MFSSVINTIENERPSMPSTGAIDERNRRSPPPSMACFRCRFRTIWSRSARVFPCLSKLEWLLPCKVLRAVCFVSPNDPLYERMAHDVSVIEMDEGNSFKAGNHVSRFDEAGHFPERKID